MSNGAITRAYDFTVSDQAIHKLASAILLSEDDSEFTLTQGKYAYQVKGGTDGSLYYRKLPRKDWILIANWCFYRLYIAIRYRKPVWLRSLYEKLFSEMHFVSVEFGDSTIKLVGTDGEVIRGRKLRLSPPNALREVLAEKFHFTPDKIEKIRAEMKL